MLHESDEKHHLTRVFSFQVTSESTTASDSLLLLPTLTIATAANSSCSCQRGRLRLRLLPKGKSLTAVCRLVLQLGLHNLTRAFLLFFVPTESRTGGSQMFKQLVAFLLPAIWTTATAAEREVASVTADYSCLPIGVTTTNALSNTCFSFYVTTESRTGRNSSTR